MLVLELDGVEVDRCDRCGGTWLDAGELALVLETRGAGADRLNDALHRAADTRPTGSVCPRCSRPLRELSIAADPDLMIDRCPRGHGVWLDRGEMAEARARFAGESPVTAWLAELYPADRAH
jgi:Zn-finger nucleic acid-binding protein